MRLEYRTYEEARKNFKWSERWEVFDGNRERFNIAHECVSRHASEEVAIRIKFDDRHKEVYTFREFDRLVSQFANLLERLGIRKGDRIVLLLPPSLEYYVSMFGTLKRGAVVVPCSPLFGPEAISFRIENSDAKAIVASKNMESLIDKKFVSKLQLVEAGQLRNELRGERETYDSDTSGDTLAMIQFSSGTTGAPKQVMYRHEALTVSAPQIKFQVGLQPDDNFFCPSSPAWGHGIWFGTMSPLIFGRAIGAYSGKFDAEILLEALEEFEITNMSAISSHYRLIMNSGKIENYRLESRPSAATRWPFLMKMGMNCLRAGRGKSPYGTAASGPGWGIWLIKTKRGTSGTGAERMMSLYHRVIRLAPSRLRERSRNIPRWLKWPWLEVLIRSEERW